MQNEREQKAHKHTKTKKELKKRRRRNRNKKIPCMFWWWPRWNLSQLLVFTFWFLSGSVSGFLSAPGLTVLFLKTKNKKTFCWLLSLPSFADLPTYCRYWQGGRGGRWARLHFSFLVFQQGMGLSLGYSNHRCPISIPCPQSTVQPTLSIPCSCAILAPINHLTLHPIDQSMRSTEWE